MSSRRKNNPVAKAQRAYDEAAVLAKQHARQLEKFKVYLEKAPQRTFFDYLMRIMDADPYYNHPQPREKLESPYYNDSRRAPQSVFVPETLYDWSYEYDLYDDPIFNRKSPGGANNYNWDDVADFEMKNIHEDYALMTKQKAAKLKKIAEKAAADAAEAEEWMQESFVSGGSRKSRRHKTKKTRRKRGLKIRRKSRRKSRRKKKNKKVQNKKKTRRKR